MAQLLTGDRAKCLISVQSKDYVLDYCIWKAVSEESARVACRVTRLLMRVSILPKPMFDSKHSDAVR